MTEIKKYKYVILGAGPSGLSFANRLLDDGETSFIVLEKESKAGGLCRSAIVDGSPLDIGGGHVLDTHNKKALEYLFKFMPESEWNIFDRISKININGVEIDYPFESNIWQFPIEKQIDYLLSMFKAGSNLGKKLPLRFTDWISWKLGNRIASDYMIPYNEKIWSINLNKLGTYWLHKLPNVSINDTLLSCLEKKPSGNIPVHNKFYYPKIFGYGELWNRMAERLGEKIVYNYHVKTVDIHNRLINRNIFGNRIVNTIPWTVLKFSQKIPDIICRDIKVLEYSSIRISYHKNHIKTDSHWTYIPDKKIANHRILFRSNYCPNSRGCWFETNEKRAGLIHDKESWFYFNKFAYPLNTIEKPKSINRILKYFSEKEIYGLGRWGEWEHMNSDIAVVKGLELAEKLL